MDFLALKRIGYFSAQKTFAGFSALETVVEIFLHQKPPKRRMFLPPNLLGPLLCLRLSDA